MDTKVYTFSEFVKESYDAVFEQDLSNISAKTILAGASKSDTTSKSAINKLKDSIKEIKIEGDLTKEGALFRDSNKKQGGKKDFYYGKKTTEGKDYIKIGDEKINGDKGETVSISLTFGDLLNKDVEASGNGIYALGRLWRLFTEKNVDPKDQVVLALNLKNPGGFIASVKSGLQNLKAKYAGGCLYTMIASDAIVPDPKNQQDSVKVYNEKKFPIERYFGNTAVPSFEMVPKGDPESKEIKKGIRKKLQEKGSIDISKTVEEISGKKITSQNDANKIISKISNSHLEEYIKLTADRFKSFLDISAENAGIPKDVFDPMKKKIDNWRDSEIKNKNKYIDEVKTKVSYALNPTIEKEGEILKGASTETEEIKRKEGEI